MSYSAFCRFVVFCGSLLPVSSEDCLQRLNRVSKAPANHFLVSWKQGFG